MQGIICKWNLNSCHWSSCTPRKEAECELLPISLETSGRIKESQLKLRKAVTNKKEGSEM